MQDYVFFGGLSFLINAPFGLVLVPRVFDINPLKGLWYRKVAVIVGLQGAILLIHMILAYMAWRSDIPLSNLHWMPLILWIGMSTVLQIIFWPVAKSILRHWTNGHTEARQF